MSPAATCQAPVSAPVSELSALTLADRRELWNYRLYAETQQTLLGSTSLASAYHSVQSFLDREYTLHDISSKFHLTLYTAAARADSEAATSSSSSSSSLLLVVDIHRTDARPEGQRADPFQYKPIDSLWKDVAGWPTSLVLSFPDLKVIASPPPSSSSYSCFLIPASQDSDSLRLVFAIEAAASPVISSNIPKIIHQSFVKPLTPPIAFSVSSFTTLNPQYTHRFVTSLESARHDLVKFEGEDSDAVKAWDLLNPIAFKIDLWRYVVMYHLG